MIRNELDHTPHQLIGSNTEVVIKVLSPVRSIDIIYRILDEFATIREEMDTEYAPNPVDKSLGFETERAMLQAYLEQENTKQSFYYWHAIGTTNKLSVGIDLTNDGCLIMCVVHIADGKTEYSNLDQLKTILNSEYGTFMYGGLPPFADGEDFKTKYHLQNKI